MISPEKLDYYCEKMHDAYEASARKNNWSTNLKSRVPWSAVPEENKATMRDAVSVLVATIEYENKS